MKTIRTCQIVIVAACLLALVPASHANAQSAQPRVIPIIADRDNTFKVPGNSRPVIVLAPGEKVILRFTAHFGGERAHDNSVHSFVVKNLADQGWSIRLKEGIQDLAVNAPLTPGEYLAECTVKCGRGHDEMNMKVIVRK